MNGKPIPKKKKNKVWTTKKCDTIFSIWIRQRDGKCARCGKTDYLQCSHFWARAVSAVRYDPDNCVALCYGCHYGNRQYGWEYNKQGDYRLFMIKWLGQVKYDELENRAKTSVQRSNAIIQAMSFLSTV